MGASASGRRARLSWPSGPHRRAAAGNPGGDAAL